MEKMNKEGWPISFEQLLKATEEGREYVGCGNPNARILIIASEVAISPNEERYKWEISDNNLLWRMEDGIAETIVHDGIIDDISKFSPRFPYKGQKYSVWSEVKKGDVTRIRSISGTSRTWYNYQKLMDKVRGLKRSKEDLLDFHDICFTSELSTICAKKSNEVDEEERKDSISRRAGKSNRFFSSDFFQAFPIVIVASKNYISRYRGVFSVEDLFGLSADSKRLHDGFYTYSRQGDSPKLLICCRHFASHLSDSYIDEIASAIREFKNKNNIQV
ncbi:MAG: hypothetical protein UHK44_09680 [Bacteroidaceae bacterium]|nr:hypothetical protein [Bacteroidaceae bacterium]